MPVCQRKERNSLSGCDVCSSFTSPCLPHGRCSVSNTWGFPGWTWFPVFEDSCIDVACHQPMGIQLLKSRTLSSIIQKAIVRPARELLTFTALVVSANPEFFPFYYFTEEFMCSKWPTWRAPWMKQHVSWKPPMALSGEQSRRCRITPGQPALTLGHSCLRHWSRNLYIFMAALQASWTGFCFTSKFPGENRILFIIQCLFQ